MKTRIWGLGFCFFVFALSGFAQTANFLRQIPEDKQNIIETIAMYSPDQRLNVLRAAAHPEILVRMGNIRQQTESSFKDLLVNVPEEDQKSIYNITRYPELMNTLATNQGQRSDQEMKDLLQLYPEAIHADATFVNQHYFDLLVSINRLYRKADLEFQQLLTTYPEDVRMVYTGISRLPEIASLLSANLDITILLGDAYMKNPREVTHTLDSLNVVVAEARANELKNWKQDLESNPEAMKEYEASAKEFASDEGNGDDVYTAPESANSAEDFHTHYDWNFYPYWFGWPWWYGYECWYPYPWWYHWGFYYGPYHNVVIWGFPSDFYLYWYFWYDPHLYYYPHYTNRIIGHYYGPRHIGSTIQPVFRKWENDHKKDLPNNWYKDDPQRIDRIREYGKFKMDYEKSVRNKTDKAPTEREFLEKNSNRYPTLRPVLKEQPKPEKTTDIPPRDYYPGDVRSTEPYPTRDYHPYLEKPAKPKEPSPANSVPQEKQPATKPAPPKQDQPKAPPKDTKPPKGKDSSPTSPAQPKKE
jgi:hypothetical protein